MKGVLLALEQRLMRMLARAVLAEDRLRHERGDEAVPVGDVAHD